VSVRELEEQITRARDRGDQEQLERLQAAYRSSAGVIRVSGPDAIRLVESQPRRVNGIDLHFGRACRR
jgi:hypothetical protein